MTPQPDLREARRLLDAGFRLCKLKHNLKEPARPGWNHKPVQRIDDDATGYGIILSPNKLCSVDPDRWDLAIVGMKALGFDLETIMQAGVRTRSTRPGSGGRSAFAAEGEIAWLKFRSPGTRTVIEFRAHSENLQDCVPGVVYVTRAGDVCTQTYANGKRLDDAPPLPDDLFAWWERCSTDIDFLREQEGRFFAAIGAKPSLSISTGRTGGRLAFEAPGIRGTFNAMHKVEGILTRHGYGFDKKTRRWYPPTATGEPGVRPIPGKDGLWRSDHASDPLSGTFDAWIAYVVLDHGGDVGAAVQAFKEQKPMGMGAESTAQDEKADGSSSALRKLAAFIVTEDKVKDMQDTRMIWRDLIALSHLSVWAAPGNGGKTTIARFAAAELAAAGFDVMFFQEDASAGDLPALAEHAAKHGYKLLNSTLANRTPADQIVLLRALVHEKTDLSGHVMFFDTLKKYLDLMNKAGARDFFALLRGLTICGATVILLGHTNKNRGQDGKLIFEGVGDVRNDVDELIYIESSDKDGMGIVTMTMRPDKVRCVVKETTFRLDTRTMEVKPLPHVVDVEALRRHAEQMREDAEAIQAVTHVLRVGGMPKFKLIEEVAAQSGIGVRTVRNVVNRYCGSEKEDRRALWIETYFRANNTRYVSLKPGGAGGDVNL
jgi:hypothetical protein